MSERSSLPVALPVRPPPGTMTAFADGVVVGSDHEGGAGGRLPSAPLIEGDVPICTTAHTGNAQARNCDAANVVVPIAASVNPVADPAVGNPFLSTAQRVADNVCGNPFAATVGEGTTADQNARGNPFASAVPSRNRPSRMYGRSQSNSQTIEYHGGTTSTPPPRLRQGAIRYGGR